MRDHIDHHGTSSQWTRDQIARANSLCRKLGDEARDGWTRQPAPEPRFLGLQNGDVLRRWLRRAI